MQVIEVNYKAIATKVACQPKLADAAGPRGTGVEVGGAARI